MEKKIENQMETSVKQMALAWLKISSVSGANIYLREALLPFSEPPRP